MLDGGPARAAPAELAWGLRGPSRQTRAFAADDPKERPHLARGVNAGARGPDHPSWQRLAAGPLMASSLEDIEHHRRVVSTGRIRGTGCARRNRRIDGSRGAPVPARFRLSRQTTMLPVQSLCPLLNHISPFSILEGDLAAASSRREGRETAPVASHHAGPEPCLILDIRVH